MKSKKLIKNIKVNDTVYITSGKDKGKTGSVKKIDRKSMKVIVENIRICTKHQKRIPSSQEHGIVNVESWISLSKVKRL